MAEQETPSVQQPTPASGNSGGATHYSFQPFVPNWVLLALFLLAIMGVRRAYSRSTRALMPELLFVLAAMRFSAFALLLLCLARPIVARNGELVEKGLCFFAVDSSGSMSLKDMPGPRSRWSSAGLIFGNQEQIAQLDEQFEIHRYVFDSGVREVSALPGETSASKDKNAAPLYPLGTSTDITALLEKLAVESGGIKTAGAILISDGRHNAPSDVVPAAQALGRAGVPVYCIGMGQDATPNDFKDVRIRQLTLPDKAFIGGRTIIRVEIESTLRAPVTVPLTVEVDGIKVSEQDVTLEPGVNKLAPEIEIPYIPSVLGLHRTVASVAPLPDEANVLNNIASAYFRVYRNKIGVWYVEGAIRKEFGAIRAALETAPNVTLKAINAFSVHTSAAADLLPTTPEDWGQIKLVIIGDLGALRFDEKALMDLAKFVENGGSVLMIGGLNNMGAGGWQESALANVLPVEMSSLDGMENGPLPIIVEPGAQDHTILNIGNSAEQNAELWKKLPSLPGVNRIRERKPAANVLLRAGDRELLIIQEFGKGRSAVFTADMTWQWILKTNQAETHRKFWRNLVTWLTRSDYRDSEKAVLADAEQLQYQVGDEALFHAHVSEVPRFKEVMKSAKVKMTLTRLQGNVEIPVFDEFAGTGSGEFSKRFALGAPGSYRFKASAIGKDNAVIDSDSVDLQVTATDIETDNPRANLKLLRRVAELTGGAYFDYKDAPKAFKALMEHKVGFSKPMTEVKDLWNSGWVLAVFFLLLTGEWFLRKRWGLI